ncbi:formylglycine-generating enzyme family protein [Pseudanabaena sp. ABRG5-3]|uniref:formylglycine-generating enzyme family protein n=1 Tax=Pseudanabaena sp. ABRG5-3 TaxID=685565 RepID=UPI000F828F27|nr:formylglycine-generating enzyme family protein [Pseudanabaena sp. ABRG5-3]
MKRRRLIQYASLSGLGLVCSLAPQGIATTLGRSESHSKSTKELLSSFEFEVPIVDRRGQEVDRQTRQAHFFSTELGETSNLTMVAIPEGRFMMGETSNGQKSDQELPAHWVTLKPFFMSRYPITQAQWQAVAQLPQINRPLLAQPAHFVGADRPIESVSWLEAVEFCDRLSHYTSKTYRLPSESEWEYACRAGMSTPFATGLTLTSELANYNTQFAYAAEPAAAYLPETTPVGNFAPNAFGLNDMHGNVWEWCADHWHSDYKGAPAQGQVWIKDGQSTLRSLRGGSWADTPSQARSASRSGYPADGLNRMIGFRVVHV